MRELTPRQRELLDAIARVVRQGRTPLTAELQSAMEVSRESSLSDLLGPLERKGFIHVRGGVRGRQRIIELSPRGQIETGVGAPVVGAITAGPLRDAIIEAGEVVTDFGGALGFRSGDFLLRVEGDSMTGDGILSGDLVLLRPDLHPHPGEIAAVQIAEEDGPWQTTLKHVFERQDDGKVELRASNPTYDPIFVLCEHTRIAGVYRGLLRGARTIGSNSFES